MGSSFRVGDVVVESFDESKAEGRVRAVTAVPRDGGGLGQAVHVRWPSGLEERVDPPRRLNVVRRPVQPGDRLRYVATGTGAMDGKFAGVAMAIVDKGERPCVAYASGGHDYLTCVEHEDGTPVDFRGSLATPDAIEPLSCFTCGTAIEGAEPADPCPRCRPNDAGNAEVGAQKAIARYVIGRTEASDRIDAFALAIGTAPRREAFSVERLALAIFRTDPDVLAFVAEKSDAVCRATTHETRLEYEGRPSTISVTVEKIDDAQRKRTLATAWSRNENGWRERAEKRAVEIVAAMKAADG